MHLAFHYPALLVAGVTLAGCAMSAADTLDRSIAPVPEPTPAATLTFDDQETLQLVPGELRNVWLTGHPPAPYEVSFSVIDDAAGAWLDRTTVTTDAAGRASVVLHAPNLASTFRLRATTRDDLAAEIGVTVSARGFGTLRVIPVYKGARQTTSWTASVVAGGTCDELASALPGGPPGTVIAQGGLDGTVLVESVPVGPNLAVALRSGHAMWGCADEAELQAGSMREVKVNVKDMPVDLAMTDLDLTLNVATTDGLDALLGITAERLLEGFLPEGAEASALLDAMERAAPPEQTADFAAQRLARAWDAVTLAHLEALRVPVRDRFRAWTAAGLIASPLAIRGRLRAVGDAAGHALFEVGELGGMAAEDVGIPPAHQMAWTADPGDVLRLGGTLFWMPSRYVAGATRRGAAAELPSAGSTSDALAAAMGCRKLGAVLDGYPACDESCMVTLCSAGIAQRWNLSVDASASAGIAGEISVNASGHAQVNDAAAPIAWTADWLGTFSDGESTEANVHGDASAVSSSPQEDGPN